MLIRSFIVGFLEMLRRVQWNFCQSKSQSRTCRMLTTEVDRLENEHLGNMDQYRVTREVPLPYAFDGNHNGDHDDEGDDSDPHVPTGNKH